MPLSAEETLLQLSNKVAAERTGDMTPPNNWRLILRDQNLVPHPRTSNCN